MTDTSLPAQRSGSRAVGRRIRFIGTIGGVAALVAIAVHLTWQNFGRADFARSEGLGQLFLYWWAFGSVIGVVSFILALRSTKPTPLLDFLGVFAIASTLGVAIAATDFSVGRLGPMNLTVPLLFPCAWFLIVRLRTAADTEQEMRTGATAHGGEK
ncbi:hypothetical protein [Arthrobacter subterraneus]|uniref:hypothetical protein n=1 Tax=Arthrobacter subterraneus TaxID=335973 RepID=UPI00381F103C